MIVWTGSVTFYFLNLCLELKKKKEEEAVRKGSCWEPRWLGASGAGAPAEGAWLGPCLHFRLLVPERWENTFLLFYSFRFLVDSYSSFRKLTQGPNKRHTLAFVLNLLSLLFDNSLPPYTVIIGESGFFCGTAHTIDLAYSSSVVLTRSSIFCIPCKLISLIRFGLNLLGKNTSSVVQLYGIVCGTNVWWST